MKDLQPILLILLVGVAGFAVYLWRRIAASEDQLRSERGTLEAKRGELERVRKDARVQKDELEEVRQQLHETRSKVRKQQQREQTQGAGGKKRTAAEPQPGAAPSVGAIVHLTDHEVEAGHRRTVERLESELAASRGEVERLVAELQSPRLYPQHEEESLPLTDHRDESPAQAPSEVSSEEIDALNASFRMRERASAECEANLRRELSKAQAGARSAIRRAQNNHQLYQVAKGQLELAEDKLGAMRRKYEGARSIEQLRAESRNDGGRDSEGPDEASHPVDVEAAKVSGDSSEDANELAAEDTYREPTADDAAMAGSSGQPVH